MAGAEQSAVRLDKWLWAARFFKTRALATAAVNGGKVQLAGQRVKPARHVRIGDLYQVRRGFESSEIRVTGIAGRRGSATDAKQLYVETEASVARRAAESEQRRLASLQRPLPTSKPNKQQRRKIRRFIQKS